MTRSELPDMGDPIPQEAVLPPWKQRFYESVLVVTGLVAPWLFLLVAATRNPGLLWLPVLTLLGTYAGLAVIVLGWRGRSLPLYLPLAGVLACWVVCTELFRRLN